MHKGSSEVFATSLGVTAILFWSTIFAVAGSLTAQVGALTSSALAFLLGGTVGLLPLLTSQTQRRHLFALRPAYLLTCGGLFVAYQMSLYTAMSLATGSRQVMEISILNYLWPTLTLLFSIPILKTRARPLLALGLCAAFAGAILALTKGKGFDWQGLLRDLGTNWLPYLLAVAAAVMWPLYSVLARRMAAGSRGNAVPLFMAASGVALLGLCACRDEPRHWSARAVVELGYMSVFPGLLAYLFWDIAMRRGRIVLIAVLSYFTPVLSLVMTSLYLHTPAGSSLWAGCLLVTVGAIICKCSMREPDAA